MISYETYSLDNLPDSFPLVLSSEEFEKVENLQDYSFIKFSSHDLQHLEKVIYFYLSFFPASMVYLRSRQFRSTGRYQVTIFYETALFQEGLDDLYFGDYEEDAA